MCDRGRGSRAQKAREEENVGICGRPCKQERGAGWLVGGGALAASTLALGPDWADTRAAARRCRQLTDCPVASLP